MQRVHTAKLYPQKVYVPSDQSAYDKALREHNTNSLLLESV